MLREKTEPGLVAFYNIRPRTGAGLFLQPTGQQGDARTGRPPATSPVILQPGIFSSAPTQEPTECTGT